MRRIFLLLLLSVVAYVSEAKLRAHAVRLGSNPGVMLRIKKNAQIEFFKSTAELASKYVNKLPIPDMAITVETVSIATHNMRISKFPPPEIVHKLYPPNKIGGTLKLPAVTLEGPFNASRQLLVGTDAGEGYLTFSVTNAEIKFNVTLGKFDNGIPKVDQFECDPSLGPGNLKIQHTSLKFAADALQYAATKVRPLYNSQICAVTQKMIETQLNRFLAKLPTVVDINPKISVKLRGEPIVHADSIDIQLFAKAITDTVSPNVPAPFEEDAHQDTHTILFISDAVVNDIFYQMHANKMLDLTITQQSPPPMAALISLSCKAEEVCLGRVIPPLIAQYGADAIIEVVAKTTKVPVAVFSKADGVPEGKSTLTSSIEIDLYATTKNDSHKYTVANANVDLTGSMKVRIQKGEIFAHVTVEKAVVHVTQPNYKEWEDKVSAIIRQGVEEHVNKAILLKGLPLKLPFGFGLEEPKIKFLTGTLQIQTGFTYKGHVSGEKDSGEHAHHTDDHAGAAHPHAAHPKPPPPVAAGAEAQRHRKS